MSAPEDNLPPVQPPSAGFLMQLFVVPMVIVVVIVMVCLMFNWLAHLGSRPADLIDDLTRLNAGSWQKALTIANLLTDRQNAELRKDPAMASRLAQVLEEQIEAGNLDDDRVKLRVYLSQALGVFEVEEGLPALLKAAQTQRDLREVEVRKAAIEALARRANNSELLLAKLRNDPELLETLDAAATQYSEQPDAAELDAQLRGRAAYALGVIGGTQALELLVPLLADSEPTVRYNAATGLARHGDPRAIPRLVQMLTFSPPSERDPTGQNAMETTTVLRNALRASIQLAKVNPEAELEPLQTAIASLAANPQLSEVVRRGIELDLQLAQQSLGPAAAVQL